MRYRFLVLLLGVACLSHTLSTLQAEEPYCAFCDPVILERQKFYEDDLVIALYTHKPIFPGHCLIIPKKHVERFEALSAEEFAQIAAVIQKVDKVVSPIFGTSAYLLLQKNGKEVGQSVPHVHFHYIPRKKGDDSSLKFMAKMIIADFKSPMSFEEMEKILCKLRETIDDQVTEEFALR